MIAKETLARPYARAAFRVARESGELAAWSRHLAFSAAAARRPEVVALLGHPRLSAAARVRLLMPEGLPQLGSPYGNFLALLAERGRLSLLPEIARQFEALRAEAEGRLVGRLRSARPLSEAEVAAIAAALGRRLGRQLELSTEVDPSLLGGFLVALGDRVIDLSVRGGLERMRRSLG
ncbi:MAG: F0F1 ATP synthase subunit delta [Xanthomonadales bacterium]|nr:F0F1 ATP synthase subunit delta [Xanthomonadales bacterium]